jgi:hypothetical protein
VRAILVDWLVDVNGEFDHHSLTLHLAVRLLDALLCVVHVRRDELQLVGAVCMLVAAKMEEFQPVSTRRCR